MIGDPGQLEFLDGRPRLPHRIKLSPASGHSIDDHAVFLPGRIQGILATGDAMYHSLFINPLFHFQINMITRRQGRGDVDVLFPYVEEPMTKPTKWGLIWNWNYCILTKAA